MMDRKTVATAFFYSMLIGALILTFALFSPYLITLAIAATMAVILQPVHRYIVTQVKYEGLAAFITVLLTIVIVLVPVTLILIRIAAEAGSLYIQITTGQAVWLNDLIAYAERYAGQYMPAPASLTNSLTQAIGLLAGSLQTLLAGTLRTLFNLFLGILAYFYMLRDGAKFVHSFIGLSPLPDGDDRKILERLQLAMNSVIRGSLIIAMLQGIASGIGLWIFGMPHAALLGAIAGVGALIPNMGTVLALGPAAVYLALTGSLFQAIGLTVWGFLFVGMIDNFLHPFLVGRGLKIHPFFILFSVVGGLSLFGAGGFILGPLTISLLFALFDLYKTEYLPRKSSTQPTATSS